MLTAGAGDSGRPERSEGITNPVAAANPGLRMHCRRVGFTWDDETISTFLHAGQHTLSETTSCSALLLLSEKASEVAWGTDRITTGIVCVGATGGSARRQKPGRGKDTGLCAGDALLV